jgi:hypothetical protein
MAPAAPEEVMNKAAGEAAPNPAAGANPQAQRKIIYNGTLESIVKDLDTAGESLQQIVKEHNAIIAQSDVYGSAGQPRRGHWRLRVPADRLDSCVEALVKLGVPQKNSRDSRDVTEEYTDLEARLTNKKKEEATLQGYLADKKAMSKLEDILKIEQELSRVRGEIEQTEGRLRLLANLSALATLDVTMHEVKDYVPPQAPTFGNEVASTFTGSLDLLRRFGEGLVLLGAALVPWLPVIALIILPPVLIARRLLPRRGGVATVLPVEPLQPPSGG